MGVAWRVYVDEAGDRGISTQSTSHFVVSAVIVADRFDKQVRTELSGLRHDLGRHPGHVLHFQKFSHSHRLKAVQDLATFSIAAITNVVICKRLLGRQTSTGGWPYISNPDPMYLWAVRLLLERVSWYVRDNGAGEALVTFAHVRRFKSHKLHSYRRALESSDTKIHWPAYEGHPFKSALPTTPSSCSSPTPRHQRSSALSSRTPSGIPSLAISPSSVRRSIGAHAVT